MVAVPTSLLLAHEDSLLAPFRCPSCSAPILVRNGNTKCTACDFTASAIDGAFDLRVRDYSIAQLPESILEWMVLIAQQQDWRVALHDGLRAANSGLYRSLTDDFQGAWRLLAPIEPDQRVLVLEAGPSGIVPAFADIGARVVSLQGSLAAARFTSLRCRQQGYSALVAVGLDQVRLPLADDSVDAIVADEVLGWNPSLGSSTDVDRFAHELRRVLRPNGSVTLVVDNVMGADRLGQLLLGRVRRGLYERANFGGAERHRAIRSYRISSINHALTSNGFQEPTVYALIPFADSPLYLVPWRDSVLFTQTVERLIDGYDWSLQARHRSLGQLARVVAPCLRLLRAVSALKLLRFLVPSLCIVTRLEVSA